MVQPSIPLKADQWTARAKRHAGLVATYADAFVKRREIGKTHPVHDFLFTYYPFSPAKLKKWVPNLDEELVINEHLRAEYSWLNDYWFKIEGNIIKLNKDRINEITIHLAGFIEKLCSNIQQQAPRFGCFGLHEWAMVYKAPVEKIRHNGYRLRLPSEEINKFVESQKLCCTHYDAFRFFTVEAKPMNITQPNIEMRLHNEQGGCVHANMDLYKWSSKLWPWIGSDFIAKAFMLALEGRELDMRASPYDLSEHGYLPICIETEEGRKQYQREQQRYAEKSVPLRKELQLFCQKLISKEC